MMDGITKQFESLMCVDIADILSDYLEKADGVMDIIKEVIDYEAMQVKEDIDHAVRAEHTDTGSLAESLTITPLSENAKPLLKKYGYEIEFKGENEKGIPYAKIANVLNYGRDAGTSKATGRKYGAIEGTHFIDEAIRPLKGMTGRINQAIEKYLLGDKE